MLYPTNYVNKIINRLIWVTQKSTEAEENRALKKEELNEKIRKNKKLAFNEKAIKNKIHKYMDIHFAILIGQYLSNSIHSISSNIFKSRI